MKTLEKSQKSESFAQVPLLTTKLALPSMKVSSIPRPRLTDRLNLSAARLLLVVAPAGWGKTSLLSEWIVRQSEGSCSLAWVSLDSGDNDPTRFLLYLTAAFANAHPGLGETTRSLLLSPQPAPTDVLLTVLLNEISVLDRSLAVVLDDYHLIESPLIHEAVTFLLDHLPPTLHLILATRVDPPLPLARMRVRGQLLEIRASDLRFTYDETVLFLNQGMGLSLDAEATANLEARTEGWIAGLQLAALSLQGRENPSEFIASFTGSNRYIMDYLFDEVLARQSEEIQDFLVKTSVLNRLCGPLCDALLEKAGGQSLLERLEAHNLFLIPLDAERHWYRYHSLFADVLYARLALQGEARTAELHRRAAAWYEGQGMGEEAIFHALEGKHLPEAARLIAQYGDTIWTYGGQRTLEKWLKVLPAEWIAAHPMLSVIQVALSLYDLRLPEALAALDACRSAAQEENSWTQDIRGRMAVLRSNVMRMQGHFDFAVAFAREALAFLVEDNPLWRGYALFSLGVALYEGDHLAEADNALVEAITESRKVGNVHTCVLASIVQGQLHEAYGGLQEATRIYEAALSYAAERKYHYAGEVAVLFAGMGRLHYHRNALAAAETALNEGLKRKHPVYPVTCYLELLRVRHARGDSEGVTALMRLLEAATQQPGFAWLPRAVAALKVRLKPLVETDATAWAASYETQTPDQPPRMPHDLRELEALTWARLRLGESQAEAVRAHLESRLTTLIEQQRHGNAVAFRVLLSLLYHQQGRLEKAVAVLEPALTLAAKEGYIRVFIEAGKPLLPVLRECVAQGIELEYMAKLLNVFRQEGLLQEEKQEVLSLLSEPLSERELEVLRLVAAGFSNLDIATHLFLSVGTIKRHVHNIFVKLDVTNRLNAISRARELNIM